MSKSNYSRCLKHILKYEGGYVDHPDDPGGATNMGITIGTLSGWLGRRASKDEVRNIQGHQVEAIYRKNYWNVSRGDKLPDGFDLVVFDGAVNSGPRRGARWFQKAIGVKADGIMGPNTLGKANSPVDRVEVIKKACKNRLSFLHGLRNWRVFGKGWGRRVASVEAEAVRMAARRKEVLVRERNKAKTATTQQKTAATGTVATGGGAGWTFSMPSMSGIPEYAIYGGLALCAVAIVVLVLKSRQNDNRVEAYDAQIKDMTDE